MAVPTSIRWQNGPAGATPLDASQLNAQQDWIDARATDAETAAQTAADRAQDAENAAAAAEAPTDAMVSTLATPGSGSQLETVLNGTYASMKTLGPGDNLASVQAWLDQATPLGVKRVVGDVSIAGTLNVPAGTYLDATRATFTQTATLRAAFDMYAGATLVGARVVGLGTDWQNTTAVYDAAAVRVRGAGVTVQGVTGTNLAGAGVYSALAPTGLRVLDCTFTGVGSSVIPPSTGQFSGGVVFGNDGATNVTIRGGSFRDFAQGIVTGSIENFYIGGGLQLGAVGQHGIYTGPLIDAVISGVVIDGVALEGIKCQIADTSPAGSKGVTIGDVTVTGCGSHGIHLANAETVPGTRKFENVVIHDVVVTHAAGGTGDGVKIEYAAGVTVHDFISVGGRRGLAIDGSTGVMVHHGRIQGAADSGVVLASVTGGTFDRIRIVDVATANNAVSEFGVHVTGETSGTLSFSGLRITDASGNTRYGFYIAAGDLTTMQFVNNVSSGNSDYGFRSAAVAATALWIGNDLTGTLGRFLNTPTNATAIADTSGATLAALEAEVNKLKARLRQTFVVN